MPYVEYVGPRHVQIVDKNDPRNTLWLEADRWGRFDLPAGSWRADSETIARIFRCHGSFRDAQHA